MAPETTGDEHRHLMSPQLETRLCRLASRMAGLGLIAAGLFCWLALLSWSAQDPSLTHAAGGAARNWMGALGAVVSDLFLQMLGLATLFGLLAPAVWGLDCVVKGRLLHVRWKFVVMALAVLMLAGGLSALPVPASWPLHHGLGGMLGDLVYRLAAGLLGILNPDRAGAAAGLVLLAGGMSATACGLGISYRDVSDALRNPPRAPEQFLSWFSEAAAMLRWVRTGNRGDRFDTPEMRAPAPPYEPVLPPDGRASPPLGPVAGPDPVDPDKPPERIIRICSPAVATAKTAAADGEESDDRPVLDKPSSARGRDDALEPADIALRGEQLLLQRVLADLGVWAEVTAARPGPVVTEFEVDLAPGIRAERVESLADDIAKEMGSRAARVAVAPGGRQVAIELAKATSEAVLLSDVIPQAPAGADGVLPVILGKSACGQSMRADLARLHNVLVAGAAESDRAMAVKAMLLSLAHCRGPAECQVQLIDPRQRLSALDGLPHLLCTRVTSPGHGVAALGWIVAQMHERIRTFSALGVDNIDAFNARVRDAGKRGIPLARSVQTGFDQRTGMPIYEKQTIAGELLARVVVVVEDLGDLMARATSEVEDALGALGESGAAAGVYLVAGVGRPTADILTPAISRTLRSRIALRMATRADSRAVLGSPGAERLLGDGDMLLAGPGGSIVRVHGAVLSDEEAQACVAGLAGDGGRAGLDSPWDKPRARLAMGRHGASLGRRLA